MILAVVAADFLSACYGSRVAVEAWRGLLEPPLVPVQDTRPFEVPRSWEELVMELRLEGPTFPDPTPSAQRDRELN